MRRLRRWSETIQVRVGTAVAVLYVAAISLVGIEVIALLMESTLILPTFAPVAPLLILGIGAFAVVRRRRIRRSAGATVAAHHVARGARVRTRTPSRAPGNGVSADLVSRHP